jgi:hypothetical protein
LLNKITGRTRVRRNGRHIVALQLGTIKTLVRMTGTAFAMNIPLSQEVDVTKT